MVSFVGWGFGSDFLKAKRKSQISDLELKLRGNVNKIKIFEVLMTITTFGHKILLRYQ